MYEAKFACTSIDITLVPGLETVYWVQDLYGLRYYSPIFSKTSVYWLFLSNIYPYTTTADKETTFCTNSANRYLGNVTLHQSRRTMYYNKPNGRHYSEQDEVLRSTRGMRCTPLRAINMTMENGFCANTGIWRSWTLFDPTVHCFTVGHYLQSRSHQCW